MMVATLEVAEYAVVGVDGVTEIGIRDLKKYP